MWNEIWKHSFVCLLSLQKAFHPPRRRWMAMVGSTLWRTQDAHRTHKSPSLKPCCALHVWFSLYVFCLSVCFLVYFVCKIIYSFFKFLLLFNYSCMPFLPIPPPHPSWTHLPPPPPPSPLTYIIPFIPWNHSQERKWSLYCHVWW